MYEMLIEFIKPELIVLIPVLYLIGIGIKKSQIEDKKIPRILGATAVLLSSLFIFATSVIGNWQDAIMAVFLGLTQGFLCAGASVYVNQLLKQSGKDE